MQKNTALKEQEGNVRGCFAAVVLAQGLGEQAWLGRGLLVLFLFLRLPYFLFLIRMMNCFGCCHLVIPSGLSVCLSVSYPGKQQLKP